MEFTKRIRELGALTNRIKTETDAIVMADRKMRQLEGDLKKLYQRGEQSTLDVKSQNRNVAAANSKMFELDRIQEGNQESRRQKFIRPTAFSLHMWS